jgi:hypothetical protein
MESKYWRNHETPVNAYETRDPFLTWSWDFSASVFDKVTICLCNM